MKLPARILIPSIALLTVAGAGVGYKLYTEYNATSSTTVAAGTPLPPTSNSQIAVLPNQDGLGTPVTTSTEVLPSTASITLPPAETSVSLHPTAPAVFDPTAARLGTTLSLLLNAWPQGGILPRQLAAAASQLAAQTGQPQLAQAANTLRSSTPREGPITLQVLLLESANTVTLTPPEDLPQNDVQAEAEKSWFRKQLEKVIQISSTPATQNRWTAGVLAVQQQLVRGAVTDAMAALETAPLENDQRLEPLRRLTRDYLSQTGKLNHLVTTYTNTYLLKNEDQ
ncbi:MAG: hypothetical protein DI585_03380 [Pseudomonas fluorescens]|nr:MAG: hypothetical protein DI585_03380 [Pseudomonas fluorescens]